MPDRLRSPNRTDPGLLRAALTVLVGTAATSAMVQSVLSAADTAVPFCSEVLWKQVVASLGSRPMRLPDGRWIARVDFVAVFGRGLLVSLVTWLAGAAVMRLFAGAPLRKHVSRWGATGWLWWCIPGLWEILRLIFVTTGLSGASTVILATPELWISLAFGGWFAVFVSNVVREHSTEPPAETKSLRIPLIVGAGMVVFAVTFTGMNWQLYRGLLIPHGDSAMYEEHLWNITHGKGFRSYLDQGLFLGEHIQVIHLMLIPLHLVWPSHMLLELCESVALALVAIPVWLMTLRQTGCRSTAASLAVCWMCYFPLHFLDISIDIKTFRPVCLAIPFLAFALYQLDRGRLRSAFVLMMCALSAKEDLAIAIASVGACVALFPKDGFRPNASPAPRSPSAGGTDVKDRRRRFGLLLFAFTTVYLLATVMIIIPAFRDGARVHYSTYFGELGSSPADIAVAIVRTPGLFFGRLFSFRSALYAILLLLPVGCLPCLSPRKLLAAVPLFGMLCLLELSRRPDGDEQFLVPFHHFHAALVPVLFWCAAHGLGRLRDSASELTLPVLKRLRPFTAAGFALGCGLATGAFYSMSPLGVDFWDSGSDKHRTTLYSPERRAAAFEEIQPLIPPEARVASTDFVHPRFTHCDRSYDYSDYRRKTSDYEDRVPDDTDFIVIDTGHRYSRIMTVSDIREWKEERDQWQLLTEPDAEFIVLRRKQAAPIPEATPR